MTLDPYPIPYETKTLERLQLAAVQSVSREMLTGLHNVELDSSDVLGFTTNTMVLRLKAMIWSDPDREHRKTHKVSYTAAHPSWKHHLTASLSEGSFLRRWCHFFWDIPFEYANTRVTENIEVYVPAVFPEAEVAYPSQFGRVHYPITITPGSVMRDDYYGETQASSHQED